MATSTVYDSLALMLAHCRAIKKLLQEDQSYFEKNNLDRLNESNFKKNFLLQELDKMASQIAGQKQGVQAYLQKLEDEAGSISAAAKKEINDIVEQLRFEISNCYNSLAVNSKIVYANLDYMRTITHQVFQAKNEIECVYDGKGELSK